MWVPHSSHTFYMKYLLNVIKLLVKSFFYSLNVWTEVLSEFLK